MQFAANKILELWKAASDSPQVFTVDFNNPKSRQALYDHFMSKQTLFSTYMMLMGYAIENMTKALNLCLKIKNNNPEVQKPAYDIHSLGLRYHDENLYNLKHVVKAFKMHSDEDEMGAAKLAVDHVLWVGKYPVPINSEVQDYYSKNIRELQKYAEILDSLFLRLEKKLAEEIGPARDRLKYME